jgi:hypothetical protein
MKSSYKLLILAVLLLFGSLTAYDFALKTEYEKGTYKDAFRNFSKLEYKNFDIIEINAANKVGVEIQYNKTFDVKISDRTKNYLKIKQVGSHLIVDLNINDSRTYLGERVLIIQCPELRELKTDAIFLMNGKPVITKDISNTTVFVNGFKQDSLKLTMNNASFIKLINDQIKYLSANLAKDPLSESDLTIDQSNLISSADINVENKGKLTLKNVIVDNFHTTISDSAQVRLSGASLRLLKK